MIPLGVLASGYVAPAGGAVALPDPVFAWAFDETSGSTAYSTVGSADLALTAVGSFGAGVTGNALYRSTAANAASCATVSGITTDSSTWTEITLAAWCYPSADTAQWMMGLNNSTGGNGTDVAGVSHVGGYMFISGTIRYATTFTPAAHSSWRHVAMTWKSGEPIRMYEDGALKSESAAYSGAMWRWSSSANVAHIKALSVPWDASALYAARMDDYRIFDAQLSAPQIAAIADIPV